MKVLIVDNEPALREMLHLMLEAFCPEVKTILSASSIEEAKGILRQHLIDLLFDSRQFFSICLACQR